MTTFVARLTCDEPAARRLAAVLAEGGDGIACSAVELGGGRWQVAIHVRSADDQTAARMLARLAGEAELNFEPVADADWVAQSLAGLPPVAAGRFVVHGAHDRGRVPVNAIAIEIEAALAFGTGHHGTTCGCLLALDALAKQRRRNFPIPPLKGEGRSERSEDRGGVASRTRDPHPARSARHPPPFRGRDKRVLDIGTGSGVLAIAAAKIFRSPVAASDIDPVAVRAARGNARLNRVTAVTFMRAAGGQSRAIAARAPYDLIFANILLGPLLRLAVPIRRLAAPGARIVLSGLLPAHANAALAIYRAQGLTLARRIARDGWVTLILKRNRPGRGDRGGDADIRR